ncbi:MAG: PAS domain S-box protein, partial [Euryarchaeota archaeon]|nr:PAS domain S-box protein [Euryarchaeota archaeon]
QFNKYCQYITGYRRSEVTGKKICDVVIPKNYVKNWRQLFDELIKNGRVEDIVIPLKTTHQKECFISWRGYPIKDANGVVRNVFLLGYQLLEDEPVEKQTFKLDDDTLYKKNEDGVHQRQGPINQINEKSDSMMVFKLKDKKLMFTNKKYQNVDKNDQKTQRVYGVDEPMKNTREHDLDKILLEKYQILNKRLNELEKKDQNLERKNAKLEEKLIHIKSLYENKKKIPVQQKSEDTNNEFNPVVVNQKIVTLRIADFFHDPLGVKRRQDDFNRNMQLLDQRKKELDVLHEQLTKNRSTLNSKVQDLQAWKEKLEQLEYEIDKRHKILTEQEKSVVDKTAKHPSEVSPEQSDVTDKTSEELKEAYYHEILDKIPQSAAIIQRGILKQVNNSFALLIGYPSVEVVEKSFFDFIAPDGLAEIEKYYLHRLKGTSQRSSYKTMFVTKDNNTITVEVNVKPTTYAGEKAEIAVVTTVENQEIDRKILTIKQ